MEKVEEEVELTKKLSKMVDRLERLFELTPVGSVSGKLEGIMAKVKRGYYLRNAEKSGIDIQWDEIAIDVCVACLNTDDLEKMPNKVKDDIIFERNKFNAERSESVRKAKQQQLEDRNGLPLVRFKWRKDPFPARSYDRLKNYVAAKSITDSSEQSQLLDQLNCSLEGYLGQPYNFDDGELAEEWMRAYRENGPTGKSKRDNARNEIKPSSDEVIRIQIDGLLDIMKSEVQDRVCTELKILTDVPPIDLGPSLRESFVWGIDCYTRRMIEICIEDYSSVYKSIRDMPEISRKNARIMHCKVVTAEHADNLARRTVVYFIEQIALPTINSLSPENAHDLALSMRAILERSNSASLMPKLPDFACNYASAVLRGIEEFGPEKFKIHPKGTGIICTKPEGIPPHVVISPYLGELYPPYRWCEKLDVVEQAQKIYNLKPTLPDFYNILLERPRQDKRGYGLLYVDASQRANMGSSCSHSCNSNCTSNIVSRNGQLGIVLTTNRHVSYGEELTMDYFSITTSEVEWRASVCLCGMSCCRGTFLHYATQTELQQVLTKNCGVLWRYATLLRSCSRVPVSAEDKMFLNEHGMRDTVFGFDVNKDASIDPSSNNKNWILKYAADNLRFVEYERKALPMALMRSNNSANKLLFSTLSDDNMATKELPQQYIGYSFHDADLEARSVMEQRIQSFVCCYSMLRRVLQHQLKKENSNEECFPLRVLLVEESIRRVWDVMKTIPNLIEKYLLRHYVQSAKGKLGKSSQTKKENTLNQADEYATTSLGGNAVAEIEAIVNEIRCSFSRYDAEGSLPKGFTSMRLFILSLRDILRPIVHYETSEARLSLLMDILVLWANTSNYSMIKSFDTVTSEPIDVVARELGPSIPRNKIWGTKQYGKKTSPSKSGTADFVKDDDSVMTDGRNTPVKMETEEDTINSNILSPNEVVFVGSKVYGKYFVFAQLMQWFNAGSDDKLTDVDLFGCVQLPLPGACFGVLGAQSKKPIAGVNAATPVKYGRSQRKILLDLVKDERSQINPWPKELQKLFNGLYGNVEDLPDGYKRHQLDSTPCEYSDMYEFAIIGSPLLDVSLGQVDALSRVQNDLDTLVEEEGTADNEKTGKKRKLSGDGRRNTMEDNQLDRILPPELPAEWVQCDGCKSWRRIAWYIDHNELPDTWHCSMNTWDPEKAECGVDADCFDPEKENTVGISLSHSATGSTNIEDYEIGSYRDVFCVRNQIYYEAKIIAHKKSTDGRPGKIKFHFKGWKPCFDEWIEAGSDRIQVHNLFTMPSVESCGKNAASITRQQELWQGVQTGMLSTSNKRKQKGK